MGASALATPRAIQFIGHTPSSITDRDALLNCSSVKDRPIFAIHSKTGLACRHVTCGGRPEFVNPTRMSVSPYRDHELKGIHVTSEVGK